MLLNPWIQPWSFAFGSGPFARVEHDLAQAFRTRPEPRLDAWRKDDEVRLALAVPGFAKEDIELSLDADVLTIRGTRKPNELGENDVWHARERELSSFTRAVRLPFRVDAADVRARAEHGVLWVTLPRAAADRPQKINIKSQD